MTKRTAPSWRRKTLERGAVLGRWVIGAFFIYMGMNKALHPVEFLKLVRQYDLVSNPYLLNSIAATLPWFEVFCGILLIFGVAVRGSALVLVGMLVPFTALVLEHALDIARLKNLAFCAVKFDCGCGTGEVLICRKLLENFLMIVFCCWIMAGHGRGWSLWFGLDPASAREKPGEQIPSAKVQ